MWCVCCLLSYKQSCDVCVVCFSLSAVNWVTRTRRWRCCRPLSCFFLGHLHCALIHQCLLPWHVVMVMRTFTLPFLSSRPTTLTCCRGDQVVYFVLTSTKVYHSDILPWWWGRLLCPHFHQGLASYHPVMLLWWWYHRHRTFPWTSTRLSPWYVVSHGDRMIYVTLSFIKDDNPDLLPWWCGHPHWTLCQLRKAYAENVAIWWWQTVVCIYIFFNIRIYIYINI